MYCSALAVFYISKKSFFAICFREKKQTLSFAKVNIRKYTYELGAQSSNCMSEL